jgi:hypothetical protein
MTFEENGNKSGKDFLIDSDLFDKGSIDLLSNQDISFDMNKLLESENEKSLDLEQFESGEKDAPQFTECYRDRALKKL